jgi:hypothetical protein
MKTWMGQAARATLALLFLHATSCTRDETVTAPDMYHDFVYIIYTAHYTDNLYKFLDLSEGVWEWSWSYAESRVPLSSGDAKLEISPRQVRWTLQCADGDFFPTAADSGALELIPHDPHSWHSMHLPWPSQATQPWLALPRQTLDSAYYFDLLDFLQRLAPARWIGNVRNWPDTPVPVRAPATAFSGEIDLVACLRQAVDLWNETAADSLFRWQPTAVWGVRLLHFPGTQPRPALAAKIVRLDQEGRPLRIHILAGDNYHDAGSRPYLLRGLAHELGHALLLWGHSEDRHHLLWRCGPIVTVPSRDERRAIRLWSLLPQGLDLTIYARSTEFEPER